MPLQTSGQISMSEIRNAVGAATGYYGYSLRGLSSNAGFGTPDAMSEFYGYGPSALTCNYYTAYYYGYYGWVPCYSGASWEYGYQDYGWGVCAQEASGLSNTGNSCLV